MSEALEQTGAAVADPPPVEEAPPPAAPVDDEAALDQAIEEQRVDIPGGDTLVPLSALAGVRGKLKETKAQLADISTKLSTLSDLEARAAALQQQLAEAQPYVEAYRAIQQAQPPQTEAKETPEQVQKLTNIAEALTLYTPSGELDIDRARKIQAWQREEAEAAAQRQVEPMQRLTLKERSDANYRVAMVTKGKNGQGPDPAMLQAVWSQLDPTLTATKEGAIQAWTVAMGYTAATRDGAPAPVKADLPPPLFTERAGGRDTPGDVSMSEADKRIAKDLGMTEAEYAKEAARMPWRRK